jgi:hypothetical protein
MVDTGTGASPPWSHTQEMATSPIKFDRLVETSTSFGLICCSTKINEEKNNMQDVIVINEYVLIYRLFRKVRNFEKVNSFHGSSFGRLLIEVFDISRSFLF